MLTSKRVCVSLSVSLVLFVTNSSQKEAHAHTQRERERERESFFFFIREQPHHRPHHAVFNRRPFVRADAETVGGEAKVSRGAAEREFGDEI